MNVSVIIQSPRGSKEPNLISKHRFIAALFWPSFNMADQCSNKTFYVTFPDLQEYKLLHLTTGNYLGTDTETLQASLIFVLSRQHYVRSHFFSSRLGKNEQRLHLPRITYPLVDMVQNISDVLEGTKKKKIINKKN